MKKHEKFKFCQTFFHRYLIPHTHAHTHTQLNIFKKWKT